MQMFSGNAKSGNGLLEKFGKRIYVLYSVYSSFTLVISGNVNSRIVTKWNYL